MKLIAFTDIHSKLGRLNKEKTMRMGANYDPDGRNKHIEVLKKKIKKYNPDYLICGGDVSIFEEGLEKMLRAINKLGKPVLMVHGNHEELSDVKRRLKKYKNIELIHGRFVVKNGITFMGWGGEGFGDRYLEFEKFVKKNKDKIKKQKQIVFVGHAPSHGTKVDYLHGDHVGSKSFRQFILKNKNVKLAFSGHIHETFRQIDELGSATLINPGPNGAYIQF